MVPGAFNYHRPDSVDAVIGLLGEWGMTRASLPAGTA